ncbi:MAG: sterol desaturase family protein [Ekhidna sp.]|uniref:beta-carotene hydroxylase n=1 Tax=Ekhidna sp. TaxID=2608089 RepID=UPI0032EAB55A
MHIIINILIVAATFFFMEGVAWFTHKYIMHGFLWSWHRSHHKVHDHALEMNDLFAVVFSIPSILTIYFGYHNYADLWWLLYIGIGILCYGIFYFIFHDIIVHRRIKIPFKAKSQYMKRIMKAHYVHHEKHTKEDAEAFGFLYAPKKYQK